MQPTQPLKWHESSMRSRTGGLLSLLNAARCVHRMQIAAANVAGMALTCLHAVVPDVRSRRRLYREVLQRLWNRTPAARVFELRDDASSGGEVLPRVRCTLWPSSVGAGAGAGGLT